MTDVDRGTGVRRITPVPYDDWDEGIVKALSALAPGYPGKFPPSNALGLLARHPALARGFLGFERHLLFKSSLPERVREIAVLRVAWRRRCRYEWAQHVHSAKQSGMTDAEIDELRGEPTTALLRAVDELDTDSRLSDQTYAELTYELDDHQLLDLVFTVGAYGLLAMAFNTFEVELDPGLPDGDFDNGNRGG